MMTATALMLLSLLCHAAAHSNLGYPLPYSKTACKGDLKHCNQPCPPVWNNARNSPERPAAEWKRGQRVTITWHKNNHIGGFYRRALVPVRHMYSWKWHQRGAFEWGCWGQGTFKCGQSDLCGGDQKGRAYRNDIVVPAVYPDGDYVFSQLWYGGLHWRGRRPKYADYMACSFVRIRGGRMSASYQPKFRPNPKPRSRARNLGSFAPGVCATGSTRIRECGGESCEHKPVQYTIPDEFRGGRVPARVLSSAFGGEPSSETDIPNSDVPQKMEKVELKEQREDTIEDARAAKEEEQATRSEDTEEETNANPVEQETPATLAEVRLSVRGKELARLKDGQRAVMVLRRSDAMRFEAELSEGARPSEVTLRATGQRTMVQQFAPYVFALRTDTRNRWMTLTFAAGDARLTVKLLLKEKSLRSLVTKKGEAASSSSCDGQAPPAAVGGWGRRYSKKWMAQRDLFVARREFCRRCHGRDRC